MAKKLSKAQERVLEEATESINYINSLTLEEYLDENKWLYNCESGERREFTINLIKKWHDDASKNIVSVTANTKTLRKLEELGYIEILSVGRSYSDTIKVLNI